MTCKDCIHDDICTNKNKMVQIDEHTWDEREQVDDIENFCSHAKNKADFVEVVRCKDCTHSVDYQGGIMCNVVGNRVDGRWYGLRATAKDHFCSYGERKE